MKSGKFALESEGEIRADAPMLPLLASGSERQGEGALGRGFRQIGGGGSARLVGGEYLTSFNPMKSPTSSRYQSRRRARKLH